MLSLLKAWYKRHFSQPGTIEFALVLISAFIIIYYFMWLVGPIVIALCLAFCLDWAVEFMLQRFKMTRRCASSVVMIVFCSIVVVTTILIIPNVIKQGAEFYNSILNFSSSPYQSSSNYEKQAQQDLAYKQAVELQENKVNDNDGLILAQDSNSISANVSSNAPNVGSNTVNKSPGLTLMSSTVFQNKTENFNLTIEDLDRRIALEVNDFLLSLPDPIPSMFNFETIEHYVGLIRINVTNKTVKIIQDNLMPSVVNAFTWLVYLLIVPIFTFLMLYNKEELQRRAKRFILPSNQDLIRYFWPSIHQQIAGYIRGKILHIIIIAIANSLAFILMGVNYALLLGVGVGLSVVIPYVGAVIIAVPVILVAVLQFGFSSTLLWVLIVYTIIQLLDSNVLTPMLFSKAMNLDAFSILAAILIFGGLWGFWGVFFAIPLATFIKTIILGWPSSVPHPLPPSNMLANQNIDDAKFKDKN